MDDVLYLGLTCLFFLLALLVLKGVERLWAATTRSASSWAPFSSATSCSPFSSRSVS